MDKKVVDAKSQHTNITLVAGIFVGAELVTYWSLHTINLPRGLGVFLIPFLAHIFIVGTLKPTFEENKKKFLISAIVAAVILLGTMEGIQ